jgi:putative oxidoreductase
LLVNDGGIDKEGVTVGSRSTELGKLLLRGAVGGPLVYAGVKHARSQKGTSGWLKSIGFTEPDLNAKIMAASELGAGAAILSGTLTTAGAASTVGVMTVAIRTVHAPNGYSIEKEGYEFTLSLLMAAAALAAFGPGSLSGDRLLGLDRKLAGWLGAVLAIAGIPFAFGHLAAFWRKPAPKVAAPPAAVDNNSSAAGAAGDITTAQV